MKRDEAGGRNSMSPLPSSCSAPLPSRIVRESIFDDTRNEMRAGRFALIRPVMTSTDGRCVARIRWMPTARAICASRQIDSSTSLLGHHHQVGELVDDDDDEGQRLGRLAVLRRRASSAIACWTLRLYCSMLRTPSAASVL